MTLFLFAKQIIDMLYQYRFLDYAMVVFMVLLCFYQFCLVRPGIRRIQWIDALVFVIMILFTVSWLRKPSGADVYFKLISACVIYYLGRLYSERIKECYQALVWAAYIVVYVNFFHRIYRQSYHLFSGIGEEGEIFYYKTDLAFAMLLAAIFLFFLAKHSLLKYATLILVIPYMVLYSSARTQQALLVLIYVLFFLAYREQKTGIFQKMNWKLMVAVCVAVLVGVLLLFIAPKIPLLHSMGVNWGLDISQGLFTEKNMIIRHESWNGILEYFFEQPLRTRLWGIDLYTDYLHNSINQSTQSMYIKLLYSIGYTGCSACILLFVAFIFKLRKIGEERIPFFISLCVWLLFLGSGITVNSHEYTQMSWFPMMFFGLVVSGIQGEDPKELLEVEKLKKEAESAPNVEE